MEEMEGILWNFRTPLSRLNATIPIKYQQLKLPALDTHKTSINNNSKKWGWGSLGSTIYLWIIGYW